MSDRPRYSSLPELAPYKALLDNTRPLERGHQAERERWLEQLSLDKKDDLLFELEILLKASACFANPRNHPGPPRRTPVVALDFRDATLLFRSGTVHALNLLKQLLGTRDKNFVFNRYLETVLPQDSLRTRLVLEGTSQDTPVESLVALRQAFTSNTEVIDGILRSPRVPFRLFYAVLATVQREIYNNTFFNPLNALEFRPEFDRIHSGQVLELIRSVPGEHARRLVALTFLSLFRMLRYIRLLSTMASDLAARKRHSTGRIYLVLSVLRSDARALSHYLRKHAGELLAESLEQSIFDVPAMEIAGRGAELRAVGHRLMGIRSALESIASGVALEVRRTFQHELPAPDTQPNSIALRTALLSALGSLRPAIQNAILFFGKTLGSALDENVVFDEQTALRETAERLRTDVWMFSQIVRAFAAKAEHSPKDDRWGPLYDFQYVREFLKYFRAMGYPLLRTADYPRFDAFLGAMGRLRDTDLLDSGRLDAALDECVAFHGFLKQLFEEISKRDVLRDVPFDRRRAASMLKLYISE